MLACSLFFLTPAVADHQQGDPVTLEAISVLNPDASVGGLTLPQQFADRLTNLPIQTPLRVSEEPWGDVRPRCLCTNIAVWDATETEKEVFYVEPPFGSNDLQNGDAQKFENAISKMVGTSGALA